MSKRLRDLLLLVAALCAIMILAGCYGSTKPVVKIGLIGPFEELYRDDGYAALYAAKLAVAQFAAEGGLPGHNVALVALNDNGRPEEAALQAQKLGIDPAVMGVIGPLQWATAHQAGPELAAHRLAWIAPVPLEPSELAGGLSLSASPEQLGQQAVATLAGLDVTAGRVAIFANQASALAGAQAAAASLEMEAAVSEAQPPAAAPLIRDVSGVVWLGDAAGGAEVSRLRGDAVDVPLVGGPETGSPVFRGRGGAIGAATWLSSGPPLEALPRDFIAAYRQLAGTDPSPQAVLTYDATTLLLGAMSLSLVAQDRLERTSVQEALQALTAAGWQGLSGAFSWDESACNEVGCGAWRNAPLYVHSYAD